MYPPLPWEIGSKSALLWDGFRAIEIASPASETHHWVAYCQSDEEGAAAAELIIKAVNAHDTLVAALKALVAVDDGIGPEDSFETAAQTVMDLDAAMNMAREALKLAGAL